MTETTRTEGEPHNDLTRLADQALDALPGDLRAIVLLDRGEDYGVGMKGFDDDMQAVVALIVHLRAILRANGKDLMIGPA